MTSLPDLDRAVTAFLDEAEAGFPEALHELPFPRAQGFETDTDIQAGDVFQRAVLLEALAVIHAGGQHDLSALIAREADYLLSRQNPEPPGGWRYFPDLAELPPDADDLAQCIRALLAADYRREAFEAVEQPVSCYLTQGRTGPGRYETWLVPGAQTRSVERQNWWIDHAWGRGADCEVIANMVVALQRLDAVRYGAAIAESQAYLERQQGDDGSWPSTWYYGPFYPGWVCRLALGPDARAVAMWREQLHALQRPDGGWGLAEASDAQNTALALLTLDPSDPAIPAALDYLARTQEADGLWPGCFWIRMELGRATGHTHTILSYGSRVIGAGYVLQALRHVEQRIDHGNAHSSSQSSRVDTRNRTIDDAGLLHT